MFRIFGEDYLEKKLEETHVFPTKKSWSAGGGLRRYSRRAAPKGAESDGLHPWNCRQGHRSFSAWKNALSVHQLDEIGELFEEIEHRQFGKDGFDDAVAQIAKIEAALGTADIPQFPRRKGDPS